ncbi:hypothetical protein PDESU_03774 [Pontiella desulfatans]|uniref:Uncharacterized protein n=1 Tax=Pontiella desulfatans TaxID=2750659 RepID=A0A6C2U553_PONDE|nr:hypothetical protein PDESU_03774 [Pontiella desulfatans]
MHCLETVASFTHETNASTGCGHALHSFSPDGKSDGRQFFRPACGFMVSAGGRMEWRLGFFAAAEDGEEDQARADEDGDQCDGEADDAFGGFGLGQRRGNDADAEEHPEG